ncbi:hypothetical protein PBI_TRISCUIT_98 [Microbacterium phage Triscuit]|nr:hypothetical protein PBI_TRISCUIT_98 [Microbacterium phage Triscuit]
MADVKQCDIRAPHERHNWQSSQRYEGFVPQVIPLYHVCNGRRWQNAEVYEKLKELITDVLKEENKQYWQGGLNPATRITEAIWQDMVGFVQPEDMPLTFSLGGHEVAIDGDFTVGPGKVFEIPTDPMTRIADAVEKIESYMRPLPPEAYKDLI